MALRADRPLPPHLGDGANAGAAANDSDRKKMWSVKPAELAKFSGDDQSKLEQFITGLELIFRFNQKSIRSDEEKIQFAVLHMTDGAQQWAAANLLVEPTPVEFATWKDFAAELRRLWGDRNAVAEAEVSIRTIKQAGEFASYGKYVIEFDRLRRLINQPLQNWRQDFYNGLCKRLKDQLSISDRPQGTLEELKTAAQALDARHQVRQREVEQERALIKSERERGEREGYRKAEREIPVGRLRSGTPGGRFQRKENGEAVYGAGARTGTTQVKEERTVKEERAVGPKCYACGTYGHIAAECKAPRAAKLNAMAGEASESEGSVDASEGDDSEASDFA